MYAVIESGGKQFRVELGTEFEVARLEREPGQAFDIDRVLLVADGDNTTIGRPIVDGARVSASIVRQDRTDKVTVFKYRPKARSRVKQGHRQDISRVRVLDIVIGDRSAARDAEAQRGEQERERAAAAAAAERKAAADKALAERLAGDSKPEKAEPRKARGQDAKAAAGTAKADEANDKPKRGGSAAGSATSGRGAAAGKDEKKSSGRGERSRTQAPAPSDRPKRGSKKGE